MSMRVSSLAAALRSGGVALALGLVAADAAAGRALTGTVQILAKGGKVIDKSAEPRWAVVAFRPQGGVKGLQSSRTFQMVTQGKEFHPRVLVVPVGSRVEFPNQDPILHNVFSVSGNNAFDLGLYRKGPGKSVTFKAPGFVRVFCNVHQSMVAFVAVMDTPFTTQPDATGAFSLSVPDGAGTLEVWHEQTDPLILNVAAGSSAAPLFLRPVVVRPRLPNHLNKVGKPYDRGRQGDYN